MFFQFCGLSAAAVQALMLLVVLDGPPVPIGVAWVWFGASPSFLAYTVYLWTRFVICLDLKWRRSELLGEFSRWGIEWDPISWSNVTAVLLATVWCVWTSWLTVVTVVCSLGDFDPVTVYSVLTLLWLIAFGWPLFVAMAEFDSLKAKATELSKLPQVFRRRFPPSEILSIYDCLHAPGVPRSFWDEYKKLSTVQVTEVNNHRFRTRSQPYVSRDNADLQRTILFVAALAVLVAILVALPTVLDVLTGGEPVLDWLRRAFSASSSD